MPANNFLFAQNQSLSIGSWREHLPYNSAKDVAAANNMVFAATPFSLFSVSTVDNTIQKWSKMNGLSETGIARIGLNADGSKLLIAYENSNLDALVNNEIINVPDIKRFVTAGSKKIWEISFFNNSAYLSTDLGVVIVDADKWEIKDTWSLNFNNIPNQIYSFTSAAPYYYAATAAGLARALQTGVALNDIANWELLSGKNGLPAGVAKHVKSAEGNIFVNVNSRLYALQNAQWTLVYDAGWKIENVNSSEQKIFLAETQASGDSRVRILNANFQLERNIQKPGFISLPKNALLFQNNVWVVDSFGGLSRFAENDFENYKLNGPEAATIGNMLVKNGELYATAGTVNDAWQYQYNGNGLYFFKNGEWTNINRFNTPMLDTLLDFLPIVVDKKDAIWAGSFGGGLLQIDASNKLTIYKKSFLDAALGDPSSYRVSGLAVDDENNIWLTNYGTAAPLKVITDAGNSYAFTAPFSLNENGVGQVLIDDYNTKWIVATKAGGGLLAYNSGENISTSGDDRWRKLSTGNTAGNLPEGNVICLAKDKDGFIWVGTTNGIGVLQCPDLIFNSGCNAVWPIVKTGNFAGYLFNGQQVNDIAVDGANRKWVASPAGVTLLSADGETVLIHFTENNSPLLSNIVNKITIDGASGEVFFATAKGLCSYKADATEAVEDGSKILVYPNPVPPDYAGQIGIKGLPQNALVKITELNGRLVHQTRALGGQATWNGRNYTGQKIASGVYLVFSGSDNGAEKMVGKIVFISK